MKKNYYESGLGFLFVYLKYNIIKVLPPHGYQWN